MGFEPTRRWNTCIQQNRLVQHWPGSRMKSQHFLPLSVRDLTKGHRGTIQGQRPLLQHPHGCTLLGQLLFYGSRERSQCGLMGNLRKTTSTIAQQRQAGEMCFSTQRRWPVRVCEQWLTVVGYLERVLAFSSLPPAAHSGESPVLVACSFSASKTQTY